MKYVPPFEMLKAMVTLTNVAGTMQLSASYEDFLKLLKRLICSVEVDEEWYLRQYDDVALAIKNGTVKSAQDHFVSNGFVEGRMPFPITVDERWYLNANADVAANVQNGTISSGQVHFDTAGYREGRLPFRLV